MFGHAMPSTCSSSCGGMLRATKMPAWVASTRNIVLSPTLAVTVTVSVVSYTPSSTPLEAWCSWMSTCGVLRSRKICGALGISTERSFTYSFSIEKTGSLVFCGSLMVRPSGGKGMRRRDGARKGGASGCGEQRVEPAGTVEGGQVVVAADVALAYVDLRHRAATGALHHLVAAARLQVDADLLDVSDALGLEQPLGHEAVRADTGGIHEDLGHGRATSRAAGSPCAIRR